MRGEKRFHIPCTSLTHSDEAGGCCGVTQIPWWRACMVTCYYLSRDLLGGGWRRLALLRHAWRAFFFQEGRMRAGAEALRAATQEKLSGRIPWEFSSPTQTTARRSSGHRTHFSAATSCGSHWHRHGRPQRGKDFITQARIHGQDGRRSCRDRRPILCGRDAFPADTLRARCASAGSGLN